MNVACQTGVLVDFEGTAKQIEEIAVFEAEADIAPIRVLERTVSRSPGAECSYRVIYRPDDALAVWFFVEERRLAPSWDAPGEEHRQCAGCLHPRRVHSRYRDTDDEVVTACGVAPSAFQRCPCTVFLPGPVFCCDWTQGHEFCGETAVRGGRCEEHAIVLAGAGR